MSKLRRVIWVMSAILGAAAVFKEFSQPRGLRVGEGKVFGVPYSLRLVNSDDLRRRYWNPDGDLLGPPILGVGVTPNLPALLRKVGVWPS